MLYCLMFFQSVLDPIAHDYSQVQNCMHKQLQQQFTDCELNQPIVSTISCSLLIWKEPRGMIASAISQLWPAWVACAILHPQTWNVQKWHMSRNFILGAPNMQPDVPPRTSTWPRGPTPRSPWRLQTFRVTTLAEKQPCSHLGRGGSVRGEALTWVGVGKGSSRLGRPQH